MSYLDDFLEPIDEKTLSTPWVLSKHFFHTELNSIENLKISEYTLFFLGVNTIPNSKDRFSEFRKVFYSLSLLNNIKICDLGNIKSSNSKSEILSAYLTLHKELNVLGKTLVILSNDEEIASWHFKAHENESLGLNFVSIDKQLNIKKESISAQLGYMGQILNRKNKIEELTSLASQEYFVQEDETNLLKKKLFTNIGLGQLKTNINKAEPPLRTAHIVNYNLNAIQNCYLPSIKKSSPNGLDSREACILSNFIGSSDKLKGFAIYPYPINEISNFQENSLIAQMLWYFFKSYSEKIIENPTEKSLNFTKYIVNYNNNDSTISFYKSNITNRWWIEFLQKDGSSKLFPCNKEEYELAIKNQIPDEWIKYFNKIGKRSKKK